MISLIHPSRGRPKQSRDTIRKWVHCASNKYDLQILISIDSDDDIVEYSSQHNMSLYGFNHPGANRFVIRKNKSVVDAVNEAARVSDGNILIVVSDDTECFDSWDQVIIQTVRGKTDWILKTQDGIQNWIITMPVMDRAYYNRFGYIYHPDYLHMFCDTELSCVADLTGRRITSNLLFKHNHYSVTGAPKDAISAKADATWEQGEKLFVERYKKMFDLKLGDIKGRITDKGMINWIARK